MSTSYLSQPAEYSPTKSNINLPLTLKVLEMKQGKYDVAKQQIQGTLDAFGQMQVLRPEDNEYIAAKLKDITTQINEFGEKDLSQSNTTDALMGKIKSVARDPFVLNAMQNTAKYRKFQQEVATIKDKKRDSYSDINYQDALKQAGHDKYMRGETDEIGTLAYKDYINAPKVLNESVAKWAKDHGYRKEVDSQGSEYFITTTTKEVLTKEEITNYIQSTLDPSIQEQLQINARYKYGNLSENDLNTVLKQTAQNELASDEIKLARLKALEKTETGERLNLVKNSLKNIEQGIADKKTKLQEGTFDKNMIYSIYQNDLFNSIAESYDRDAVIDIDYNTVPLEIAKFEADKAYKAEDLKLKKYALDNKNSQGVPQESGTPIPEAPQTEDKEDTVSQVRQSFLETQSQLVKILEATDPDYQARETKEAKQEYMLALVKSGGAINPNTDKPLNIAVLTAVNNHRANYDAYLGYKKEIITGIDNQVTTAYNDLLDGVQKGSNLKVENLARTMPTFGKLLKEGKQFSQLTDVEKEALRYEFISNAKAYGGDSDNDESYQLYLDNIKQRKAGKNNRLIQEQEGAGLFSGMGNTVAGFGQLASGTIYKMVGGLWQSIFQGERASRETREEGFQQELDGVRRINRGLNQFSNFETDFNPLVQDTNITELEGFDTGSGEDVWFRFKDAVNANKLVSEGKLKPYLQTMPEKMSYSFSTASKEQKPTAITLQQIALKNGGATPSEGDNNYNLSYDAKTKQFAITYLTKSEKNKVMSDPVIVDEQLMPKEVRDRFRTSQQNWNTSIRNPKAKLPSFTYSPPTSQSEAKTALENLNVIAPNTFSEQEIHALRYNPLFYAPQDRYTIIAEANPSIKENQNQQQALNTLVNSTIEVVPVVSPNVGFFADVFLVTNGQKKRLNTKDQVLLGQSYDPQDFLRRQLAIVGEFTNREIDKIKQIQ